MRIAMLFVCVFALSVCVYAQDATQGTLNAFSKKGRSLGACPLKTTGVTADVSGFVARVRVRQEFHNAFTQPIEAVYVFPLSEKGAVDQMTMTVGTRTAEQDAGIESAGTHRRADAQFNQGTDGVRGQKLVRLQLSAKLARTWAWAHGSAEYPSWGFARCFEGPWRVG
jgi:hypothetical protein